MGPPEGGGYTITGTVQIAGVAPADVVPWLVEPEALDRWMVGIDGIEVQEDGGIRVLASMGGRAGWVFRGAVAEASDERVVRRYALEELSAGGVPLAADTSTYARTVTYDLEPAPGGAGGTRVTCTAVTVIPGLAGAAAGPGARKEQRTLQRSLERLEALAGGRGVGLLGRLRGSGQVPAPL